MSCGIYKITNKLNNMSYIGQSKNVEFRFEQHINKSSHYTSKYLWSAFDKYGIENFEFDIIEECSIDKLQERERYWIEKLGTLYPNGYNGTNGGETLSGFRFNRKSEKQRGITIKRNYSLGKYGEQYGISGMVLIHKDNEYKYIKKEDLQSYLDNNWIKGMKEEDKLYKERNGMYGKHHSEETKKKLSHHLYGEKNPFYGKKHTEETRKIISEGRMGDKNPCYNKIWITKNTSNKRIDSSELDRYTNDGWKKGRYISEETRRKQSKVKRNRDKLGHFI